MPLEFIPLTKFQRQLLDEHFNERGHSEGYQRTYQRLKLIIKDKTHYAMNKDGDIARVDGEILEEVGHRGDFFHRCRQSLQIFKLIL